MTTAQLTRRVQALEIVKQPALVIDAVVIGGAPVDGKVIVIGGPTPADWRRPDAKPTNTT